MEGEKKWFALVVCGFWSCGSGREKVFGEIYARNVEEEQRD